MAARAGLNGRASRSAAGNPRRPEGVRGWGPFAVIGGPPLRGRPVIRPPSLSLASRLLLGRVVQLAEQHPALAVEPGELLLLDRRKIGRARVVILIPGSSSGSSRFLRLAACFMM